MATTTEHGTGIDRETEALLRRLGAHERGWAYVETLARVAGQRPEAAAERLAALERDGLALSTETPMGLEYRLSERGADLRRELAER